MGQREQDLEQLTKAIGTGRETAAQLKALQGKKDDSFFKTVSLAARRPRPQPQPDPRPTPARRWA